MPSPIGHALAAITAGCLAAPRTDEAGRTAARPLAGRVALPALMATAGLVPDLDLLVAAHSGPTHSLGAAVLAGALVALAPWRQVRRLALAVSLAYLSHVLLDWLSEDTSLPLGIMALWPFSRHYWHAPFDLFFATDRRYWLGGFWLRNLRSVAWECLLLAPAAVWVFRRCGGPAGAAPALPRPER